MTGNLSNQQPPPPAVGGTLANVHWLLGRMPSLNAHLSRFQTVVGLAAGIISIVGALVAAPNYFKPAVGKGDLVAVVVDAKTEKAVYNATVEILTLNKGVVTTLNSECLGKKRSNVDEG